MKIGKVDLHSRVFVIAEIGNNHEGNFSVAQEMLARAAETGVDAVKFQTFLAEHYVSGVDAARLERLKRFQLSTEQFAQLAREAQKLGVLFFSTPFDLSSAAFLDTIQPVFKIASGDNNFFPLIDAVSGYSKPMIVSTGFADIPLLERVHARIRANWKSAGIDPGLAFLHCVACYPVPAAQANLGAIRTLRERFPDCVIGYSDHTMGVHVAPNAVAAGARIIEKHFTLDKNYSDFRDHQLSADPADMRQLVESVREVELMMGSGRKLPQECEAASASAVRRSVAAGRDIPAGTTLGLSDLTWVRPGTGVPPGEESALVGGVTRRSLRIGDLILREDVVRQ
jgi:sialic acid synthase SpsE